MAVASETLHAGQAALHEKDVRRMGLAISVLFIGITIFAIWALIRRLETSGRPRDASATPQVILNVFEALNSQQWR